MVAPPPLGARTGPGFSVRGVIIVFSLCAFAKFVLSYHDYGSVTAALISAAGGFVGTASYFLLLALAWKYKRESTDDPREMAQWVP